MNFNLGVIFRDDSNILVKLNEDTKIFIHFDDIDRQISFQNFILSAAFDIYLLKCIKVKKNHFKQCCGHDSTKAVVILKIN